jgi:coatomer subunit zeta
MAPISLFSVHAIIILSVEDGSRILARYFAQPHVATGPSAFPNPYPTVAQQKSFEKGLLEKTQKQTTDIILYDNRVVVFKQENDVMVSKFFEQTCIWLTRQLVRYFPRRNRVVD